MSDNVFKIDSKARVALELMTYVAAKTKPSAALSEDEYLALYHRCLRAVHGRPRGKETQPR